MPHRNFRVPKKVRLGSIYLTQKGYDDLQRLIDHYGEGPSGTIEILIREKGSDFDGEDNASAHRI